MDTEQDVSLAAGLFIVVAIALTLASIIGYREYNAHYRTTCIKQVIEFEETQQPNDTLPIGDTSLATKGINGSDEVCRRNSLETSRTHTIFPTTQIIHTGTLDEDAKRQENAAYFQQRMQSAKQRVGAICSDGSQSSATGSGACSHHGGVYQWLYE